MEIFWCQTLPLNHYPIQSLERWLILSFIHLLNLHIYGIYKICVVTKSTTTDCHQQPVSHPSSHSVIHPPAKAVNCCFSVIVISATAASVLFDDCWMVVVVVVFVGVTVTTLRLRHTPYANDVRLKWTLINWIHLN